jgi:hypothetical protein
MTVGHDVFLGKPSRTIQKCWLVLRNGELLDWYANQAVAEGFAGSYSPKLTVIPATAMITLPPIDQSPLRFREAL